MDERTLIQTCFDRPSSAAGAGRRDVIAGIGDDAAVLRVEPGFDLVVATDMVVAGTHFPEGIPPASIGHRALAVNLSDLGAMAAEPLWFSLALSLPVADEAWTSAFAQGMFALADRHAITLIGGDTVRGPLGATVTVHGRARPGCAVLRTGAAPGDGIWVTGHPGDAVAGRLLLPAADNRPEAEALRQRFLYPEPRVREGLQLAGIATAMLDVSDGLDDDIRKLMEASGMGAELDAASLQLSAALRLVRPADAVELALTGGDDYELCFTVRPADEARLRGVAAGWSVPVTRIGTVVARPGCEWWLDGRPFAVPDTTYRHFT